MHYDCIKLFYNDIDLNIQTFSIQFYQEGLTITAPQPLYINDERLDIDSLLTYFFNHNANKISYGKFVKTRKNLIYKKCFETWIPLIFLKIIMS